MDLVQGIDAVVWEMEVSTFRYTFVSQRAEPLLGYPTQRWLEEPTFWQDTILHPEDRAGMLEYCQTATQATGDNEFDYRAVRADGETIWIRDRVRVVRDETGAPRLLRGVMIDVSGEKQAVEELRKREGQLAEAQAVARLGSWEVDVRADRVTWSDETYRLCGLEPRSVEPTTELLFEIVHSDDRALLRQVIDRAVQMREPYCIDARLVLRDGFVRHVQLRGEAVVDIHGQVVRLRGTAQDTTEQRQAEEAARITADRMRAVAGAAAGVVGAESAAALLSVLRDACRQVISLERFSLGLYDEKQNALHFPDVYDADATAPAATFGVAGTPDEQVIRTRRSLVTLHSTASEAAGVSMTGLGCRSESIIRTPVVSAGRVLGIIMVESDTPALYTPQDVEVLEALASLAATALLNIELLAEREAAAVALGQSESKFRALFEKSPDAIFLLDGNVFIDCNQAAVELMRCTSKDQILGRHPASLSAEFQSDGAESFARAEAIMAAAFEEGSIVFEWLIQREDGAVFPAEVAITAYPLQDGQILHVIARDITARKHAEDALLRANEELEIRVAERTAELAEANAALEVEVAGHEVAQIELIQRTEELEAIFRALPDLYFRSDADGIIRDYRSGAGEDLYFPPDLLLHRPLAGVLPPELSEQFVDALAELRQTGQLVHLEYRLPFPDGARDYEARMLPLADGSIISVVRNITDRVAAERELKKREEHFRRLIENAHDMVQVIDLGNRTLYVSPSVERILGYTPEELVGRVDAIRTHPDDIQIGAVKLAEAAANPGTTVHGEFRVQHKDGCWRVLEVFGRTLSPTSAEEGIVSNARDITERKQFEKALEEREEWFRSLIENAHDLVMVLDSDGTTIYVSPSVERILGYTPEELAGSSALDLVDPDQRAQGEATLADLYIHPGSTVSGDFRLRHKDGSYRILDSFGRLISVDAPERGVVVNARDITEREQFQRALQEREEHFRKLIETSHDLVQTLDSQGRIVYTGPSVERLLGYTPEEITGSGVPEFIHPDDQPLVQDEIIRALSNPGEIVHVEYRVLHKDGRWRWFESMGRTLSPESPEQGIVANARDITERREAEAELKRQRAYFEQILISVDAGIAAWDAEGRWEYVSPNAVKDPGVREWIIGMTHHEYCERRGFPVEIAELRARPLAEAIETRKQTEFEEMVRRPDGSESYMLRRYWPVLNKAGAVERVIGYSIDITERKRTEEAVRQATVEAEQAREAAERANRAKSEFLSRMSHELRTPMNSILGFAQLLARKEDLPPDQRKGVDHILKAGRHLLNLINEVLEIARIEAGRHSLSLEPVRLGAVLEEAVGLVRPLAAQWRVDLDHGPWPCCEAFVKADRQRLTQVLLNVLANGIKYNRAGGRVQVSCAPASGGELRRLIVRITDTGRGIPADKVDQLFTPFARLGAEQSDVEGTGLGLALSQRLTEAMGGSLTLEDTGAEGSTFRLELQLAADPLQRLEDAAAPSPSPDDVSHAPATLLYIEDNLANLSLVETILLSRPQWRTLPALQGQVGVELAREHTPDLILLDLHLPDISGEEVLRRLRSDVRTAPIPVVVITADATRSTTERLRAAGADAYLTKPLDIDEFMETVERFLPDL